MGVVVSIFCSVAIKSTPLTCSSEKLRVGRAQSGLGDQGGSPPRHPLPSKTNGLSELCAAFTGGPACFVDEYLLNAMAVENIHLSRFILAGGRYAGIADFHETPLSDKV